MNAIAFGVVAFMLTAYVLLDGYDLGIAAISPAIARGARERAAAMESIGPFWNGNEVWLIAAGGALFALFPEAYASAFSGFYLPFIVVLWLLMFRGIAMELRNHLPSELWHQFWDAAFWLSSTALIFVYGLALGNLVRGVPLDAAGYFQGSFAVLGNPFALLVGAFALCALAAHGAAFAAMRIDGPPAVRAAALGGRLWWAVLLLYAATTAATAAVRGTPAHAPLWLLAMPVVSLGALVAIRLYSERGRAAAAFVASCGFLVSLLVEAAGTMYPYLLPGFPAGQGGVSIYDAAPNGLGLATGLAVTIGGSVAVAIYSSIVWRRMGGKVRVE